MLNCKSGTAPDGHHRQTPIHKRLTVTNICCFTECCRWFTLRSNVLPVHLCGGKGRRFWFGPGPTCLGKAALRLLEPCFISQMTSNTTDTTLRLVMMRLQQTCRAGRPADVTSAAHQRLDGAQSSTAHPASRRCSSLQSCKDTKCKFNTAQLAKGP